MVAYNNGFIEKITVEFTPTEYIVFKRACKAIQDAQLHNDDLIILDFVVRNLEEAKNEKPLAEIKHKCDIKINYKLLSEARAAKYTWHDLKKDPADLPKDGKEVWTCCKATENSDPFYCSSIYNSKFNRWCDPRSLSPYDGVFEDKIFAWASTNPKYKSGQEWAKK